jgi:hypothetical protein
MIRPGTYRESDGSAVAFQAAKRAWAEAARSALLRTATVYHGWISYGDLAEEVQRVSGIRTRALMHYWIGEVLGMVSHQCHARGEPLLSSLCVDASGSVGPGYRSLLSELGASPDSGDLDEHAAAERLRCYQHFGAALPVDGGRPALTPKLKAVRERARQRSRPVCERKYCPRCHVMLPLSGQCDFCG